jgi:hypothetical protein
MSLIIAGFYSGYLSLSLAAPVTNQTAQNDVIAPAWVADPSGRGTWGILSSCIFTVALCVYTAIHLNIPAKTDSKCTLWLRKIKCVLIAIFGPEIVVLTALDQWPSAKRLLIRLKDPSFGYVIDKVRRKRHRIIILGISLSWLFLGITGETRHRRRTIKCSLRLFCRNGRIYCQCSEHTRFVRDGDFHRRWSIVARCTRLSIQSKKV